MAQGLHPRRQGDRRGHVGDVEAELVLHARDHHARRQRRSRGGLHHWEVDLGHRDHGAGALPQHLGVGARIGVQPVEPGDAVLVLVETVGRADGLQAVVEEARPVGGPAGAGVLGPVDGLREQLAALGDQDASGGVLGAAGRGPEHHVRAVRRGGPPVQRGVRALGGIGVRVDQQPVLAVHTLADIELVGLGVGRAHLGEDVVPTHLHGGDRDHRTGEMLHRLGQGVTAGDAVEHRLGIVRLGQGVALPFGRFGFHPAIGIGDLDPEQVLGDRPDGGHRRAGGPGLRHGQGGRGERHGEGRGRPQQGPPIEGLVHGQAPRRLDCSRAMHDLKGRAS